VTNALRGKPSPPISVILEDVVVIVLYHRGQLVEIFAAQADFI